MQSKGMARFAPLAGVLFLLVAIAAILTSGDPPDADAPTNEIVEWWKDKDTQNVISAILTVYAAGLLVWFAGSLREQIARAEGSGSRLASVAFGGFVIVATGLAVNAALEVTAADTVGDVPPEVTQTIHTLYDGMYFPLGLGFGLLLLASGLAAVRHGAFDRWLGWIAIVLGVLCFTPAGFVGFLGGIVWVAIAGVVLYRKKDPIGSGAAESPLPPPV
ncbi:MAG TPA: hypothetical protein VF715_18900 [Thermoleophilaceae bacterium]|jgi:hypothetical protein